MKLKKRREILLFNTEEEAIPVKQRLVQNDPKKVIAIVPELPRRLELKNRLHTFCEQPVVVFLALKFFLTGNNPFRPGEIIYWQSPNR